MPKVRTKRLQVHALTTLCTLDIGYNSGDNTGSSVPSQGVAVIAIGALDSLLTYQHKRTYCSCCKLHISNRSSSARRIATTMLKQNSDARPTGMFR